MKLSILNGFSRVTPQDVENLGANIKSREQKPGWSRIYEDNEPGREALNGKTKSRRAQKKIARVKGSAPAQKNVAYSKAHAKPTSEKEIEVLKKSRAKMQGYSRVNYTSGELQGLSLQGQTILNGYALGDTQDLEEWDHLLNIEHPIVLNGFPSFVLNGKADRKAKRAEKKVAKQTAQSNRPKAMKRAERKAGATDRKQRRKEVRVAKKEEDLLKKVAKREDRTARKAGKTSRKQSRIDEKTKRRELKEESKQLKAQLRSARGGKLAEIFGDVAENILPDVADLVRGGGDFANMTAGDMQLPGAVEDWISQAQNMDPEDVLDERSELLEDMEETPADENEITDKSAVKVKGGILPVLAIATAVVLASTSKKGKKSKK